MDPIAEYTARRERYRGEQQSLAKRSSAIGNWRLVIGIAAAALAWCIFAAHLLPAAALLLPLVAFVPLAVWHAKVSHGISRADQASQLYDRGLKRLSNEWPGSGLAGERFRSAAHVYSEDLDLFGHGSLFELIANARTRAGEELLASWLLEPAAREEILLRQEAVEELRSHLDLREDLALLAHDIAPEIKENSIVAWGKEPAVHFNPVLRVLASLLAIAGLSAIALFFGQKLPLWVPGLILGCDYLLIFSLRAKVNRVLEHTEGAGRGVTLLAALVARLEREGFHSRKLQELRRALDVSDEPASKRIARLGRLIDWLDSSDHVLIRLLRPILLWQEQLAFALENWRQRSGSHIEAWVRAVAEFEALCSFGALAFERPAWVFPDLSEEEAARFEARELTHPLLASQLAIPNDVYLNREQRLLVISGSNMSGKSTLLRAVGLNAVLAWAGAPVSASSLRISELRVGASIRINDSLQDHRSRFFAEISRLRQIVDLTKLHKPVLFLLDELLSGTNSHDRRIGASGIVRELLRANTVGLLTTHDLALANVQQDVDAGVTNVHFEDQMNGSEMIFDYKLKPGVVTRSNALELMRSIGLEV